MLAYTAACSTVADSSPTVIVDTTDLSVWKDALIARLPGADPAQIKQEFGDTVNEFLRTTSAYMFDVTFPTTAGVQDYDLNQIVTVGPPNSDTWSGVEFLFVMAMDLGLGFQEAAQNVFIPPSDQTGTPMQFVGLAPGVIRLVPTPAVNGVVRAILPTVLRRPIGSIPAILASTYYDAILDGTVGRMMTHVGRSYSDITMAQYHMRRFRDAIRVARDEVGRRWTFGSNATQFNGAWTNPSGSFSRGY